eukprot:542791_1
MDLILLLFPETKHMQMYEVNLRSMVLSDIALFVRKIRSGRISIVASVDSELSVKNAADIFGKMGLFPTADIYNQKLDIRLVTDKYEIFRVIEIIQDLGGIYCGVNRIRTKMNKLVSKRLNASDKLLFAFIEKVNDRRNNEYDSFYKHCTEIRSISINWKSVVANPDLGIFEKFYLMQHQWINLDILTRLYPNLLSLTIKNIRLSTFVMDDVLRYLINTGNLQEINFWLNVYWLNDQVETNWDTKDTVDACKQLTDYDNDDVFDNDWKDLNVLYKIRDKNMQTNNIINVYRMDSLIVSYVFSRYKQIFFDIGFLLERTAYSLTLTALEGIEDLSHRYVWQP